MFDASREIPTRTRQSEMRRLQIGPDSTAAAEESSHGGDVGLPDRGLHALLSSTLYQS